MRHIEGTAEGSLAPALAVSTAAFLSAVATASGPVEPFAPIDSKSAWTGRTGHIRELDFAKSLQTGHSHIILLVWHIYVIHSQMELSDICLCKKIFTITVKDDTTLTKIQHKLKCVNYFAHWTMNINTQKITLDQATIHLHDSVPRNDSYIHQCALIIFTKWTHYEEIRNQNITLWLTISNVNGPYKNKTPTIQKQVRPHEQELIQVEI